jgi:hypothetical protein
LVFGPAGRERYSAVLQFVATVIVIVAGVALLRRFTEPEATKHSSGQEYSEGELPASLRRCGGLPGPWHAGALVVEGGEVWWQGGLRRRTVVLTGMVVDGVRARSLTEAWWLRANTQVLHCRDGEQQLEIGVEPDAVAFLQAALARP